MKSDGTGCRLTSPPFPQGSDITYNITASYAMCNHEKENASPDLSCNVKNLGIKRILIDDDPQNDKIWGDVATLFADLNLSIECTEWEKENKRCI